MTWADKFLKLFSDAHLVRSRCVGAHMSSWCTEPLHIQKATSPVAGCQSQSPSELELYVCDVSLLTLEAPVPVLDLGESGPLRCTRCRAYANAFFTWVNRGGSVFTCPKCGNSTLRTPTDQTHLQISPSALVQRHWSILTLSQ